MIKFSKEQKVLDIGGVVLGGQPGQYPAVMCGSIFYDRHKIVSDAKAGIFDEAAALELLDREKELAENFGLQRMPDVVGDTPQALIRYSDFVLSHVDGPILVDSASMNTLVQVFEHYRDKGVMDRLVLSPIDLHTTDEQFARIAACGVKNALIMAFSPEAVLPKQKIEILTGIGEGGLLDKVTKAGIENVLVDVGVIDLQGTAWSCLSIQEEKETLGLPAGCAPANALFSWQRSHKDTLTTAKQTVASGASVYASTVYSGANFVLYGPMGCAEWAYPACATADALMSYGNRMNGIKAKTKSHPLYRLK